MNTTSLRRALLIALMPALQHASAADWPMWRGPLGDGTTEESGLPLKWSAASGVAWKTALPEPGNSTPVVWQDRVFVTQARGDERLLLCFDAATGEQRWEAGTKWTEEELTHKTNPFCSGSPATNGSRVLAFFASAGLFCYDMDGREIWKRADLGLQRHIWGAGTSPVIRGDTVFLNFGPGANTALMAFDLRDGSTRWTHREPGGHSGEGEGKKWTGSWSDPILRSTGGRDELLMSFPGRVCAFDPSSGRELWTCQGLNALVYNSPLYADGMAVAFGGYNGMGVAVRCGGQGDVTKSHRVWHQPRVSQRIGSGVLHDGHHFILSDPGIAECRDLKTGGLVWSERLKGPGPTGQNWSSLVLSADGLCFAVNQGGDAFVFRASPNFELLATNSLGEKVIGSIAPSGGRLFIRGHRNLWCVTGDPAG
jgi:outer membrane protein assembly factor BamB